MCFLKKHFPLVTKMIGIGVCLIGIFAPVIHLFVVFDSRWAFHHFKRFFFGDFLEVVVPSVAGGLACYFWGRYTERLCQKIDLLQAQIKALSENKT